MCFDYRTLTINQQINFTNYGGGKKILSPPRFQHCGGECPRGSDAYDIIPVAEPEEEFPYPPAGGGSRMLRGLMLCMKKIFPVFKCFPNICEDILA